MNAPKVDVLAVLDEAADWLHRSSECRGDDERAANVKQARAAVAELIEAARFFEDESRRKYGDNTTGGARLRVALARIGGAA